MHGTRYFEGERRRPAPHLLEDPQGQRAENLDLRDRTLRPLRKPLVVDRPTKGGLLTGFFRWGHTAEGEKSGDIESIAPGGEGQTMITSTAHGLSSGDIVTLTDVTSGTTSRLTVTTISGDMFLVQTVISAIGSNASWSRMNGLFLHWTQGEAPDGVEAARVPLPGDDAEHVVYTGVGAPKITYNGIVTTGGTNYPEGFYEFPDGPVNAPVANTNGTGTGNPSAYVWVYTYISTFGAGIQLESAPSPPSAVLNVEDGQTVDISGMDTAPAGTYNVTHKRLYRAVSGTTGVTNYLFVAQIPVATTAVNDPMNVLVEALKSTTWLPPPTTMRGIIALPMGSMAGFVPGQGDIYLSEPFQPQAYPYTKTVESEVLALAPMGTQAFVACTRTRPYRFYGTHPSTLTTDRVDVEDAGCVSGRSLVSMGEYGAIYASATGLILVPMRGTPRNLTVEGGWLDERDWQALNPSSIIASQWRGHYVGFYTLRDGSKGGFMLDPREGGAGFVSLTLTAEVLLYDPVTSRMFILIGNEIVAFDEGRENLTYRWRSKLWDSKKPANHRIVQVIAVDYNDVMVEVIGDGVTKFPSTAIASDKGVNCTQGGRRHRHWELELTGTSEVHEVYLAENHGELAAV